MGFPVDFAPIQGFGPNRVPGVDPPLELTWATCGLYLPRVGPGWSRAPAFPSWLANPTIIFSQQRAVCIYKK